MRIFQHAIRFGHHLVEILRSELGFPTRCQVDKVIGTGFRTALMFAAQGNHLEAARALPKPVLG